MLLVCLEEMNKRIIQSCLHYCHVAWYVKYRVINMKSLDHGLFSIHSLSYNYIGSGVKALLEGIGNCKKLKTLT